MISVHFFHATPSYFVRLLAELKWNDLLSVILLIYLRIEAFAIEIHKWHLVILVVLERVLWAVLLRVMVSLALRHHMLLVASLIAHRVWILVHLVISLIVVSLFHDPLVVDSLVLIDGPLILKVTRIVLESLIIVRLEAKLLFVESGVLNISLVMSLVVE
jgi:hypothetical protein